MRDFSRSNAQQRDRGCGQRPVNTIDCGKQLRKLGDGIGHGLEAVLVAVEVALESGRPSGEHVLNVLARLKSPLPPTAIPAVPLTLAEEPLADVDRYERQRPGPDEESAHVE